MARSPQPMKPRAKRALAKQPAKGLSAAAAWAAARAPPTQLAGDPIAKGCHAVAGQLGEHDRAARQGEQDGLARAAHIEPLSVGPFDVGRYEAEPADPFFGTDRPTDSGVDRHDVEPREPLLAGRAVDACPAGGRCGRRGSALA